MAREVDPEGNRTLGLITKPDALDVGSDSEASYVKLAQNNDVVFRLGWHVLKNRDFKMRDASSAERDAAEASFFSSGIWATLDPSNLGVDLLRDVETTIRDCTFILSRLDTPRGSLMERGRGCELSGTLNPLIVGELFAEQCQPWKNLTFEAEKKVLQAVDEVEHAIVDHITVKKTAPAVLHMLRGGTDKLKKALGQKLKELPQPHSDRHPITYNDYLTDTVKRAQDERRKRRLTEVTHLFQREFAVAGSGSKNVASLVEKLNARMDTDMNTFASEMAIDYMEAYHKVAMNKFIDDVSVLAVEQCLISKLPDLFPDEILFDFKDEEIARLAGKTEAASKQRANLNQKLAILEDGRRDLMNLAMTGSFE
ncbi:hypothetical protein E4U58_001864 [Claviceps cyperi]|nr:hypothetical protein E4U58_001864 [Claviceps cyperi]